MGDKKKKISGLPLAQSLVGLFTIGVNAANDSVRVSLEWLKTAYDNVMSAISNANRATESANTAAGKANKAATDAGAQMTQISQEASAAIKAASDAAGNAQDAADNVQDGKTPILESVNAQSGVVPSGSFTQNGVDAEGNPKYILNLTSPKGKDGQPAIFEQGTTTTLEPAEDARVDVVGNGETEQGNPKYILNFFIPRGQIGKPGEGSGNVSADGTGLVIGKKYLFVPDSDGSTAGTFVEYTPPSNATSESSGLLSPEQFQKLEKLSSDEYVKKDGSTPFTGSVNVKAANAVIRFIDPISSKEMGSVGSDKDKMFLYNGARGKSLNYSNDGKLMFEDKETFAVDADNELTLAGKKLSELGGSGAVPIPFEITNLNNESTSDEIKVALGGDEGFELIYEGAKNGVCYIDMSGASGGLFVGGIICQVFLSGLDSGVQMINIAADLSVFGGDLGTYSISKNGDAYAIDVQISEKKEYLSLSLDDEGLKGFWVRSGRIDVVNLYDLFQRKITITTKAPASNNGIDGDIWIQYKE